MAAVSQIAAPQGRRGPTLICVRHHCAGPPRSPRKWRQFRRSEPPRDGEGGRGGGRKGRGRKRDAGKREQNRGRVGNKSDINLNFRMSARKSWIGAGPPSLVREARQGQRRRRRQGWSSANPRNPRGPPKDYVYGVFSFPIESLRSFRRPVLHPCCHLLRARGDWEVLMVAVVGSISWEEDEDRKELRRRRGGVGEG